MKNKEPLFFTELPSEYEEVRIIDAKNKKTAFLFTLFSFFFLVASIIPFLPRMIRIFRDFDIEPTPLLIGYVSLIVSMILYIVLHELTHGLVYKLVTHEKLTYGFTLTVAYCGVPNLYVKRRPMIIALMAPFTVFSILFLSLIFILWNNEIAYIVLSILFSIHFSGCVGDLYDFILFMFKYRDNSILVNDTGPKQTIYKRKETK